MRQGSRGLYLFLLVPLLVLAIAAVARPADEPPSLDTKRLDQHLADVLKEVHNKGADLYNQGDSAGCYRLFQGALLTVRPLLDHRAETQKMIDAGLAEAERSPEMRKRAFNLHKLIEEVRTQIKSGK